jgi:hypothetical protein
MSRFAGRVIKKYGDSAEAYHASLMKLQNAHAFGGLELSTIWHSAQRFYARVQQRKVMFHRRFITTILL